MNITEHSAEWFHEHVWLAAEGDKDTPGSRVYVQRRQDYYDGKHAILDEDAVYANGQPKAQRVMNWIKQVVMRHVGGMTPFQITGRTQSREQAEEQEQADVSAYSDMQIRQRLSRVDAQLKRDALLCGYAVEFHAFDGDTNTITVLRYRPDEWAFLWDSDDSVTAAVRLVEMEENDVYEGEVLTTHTTIMSVYTAEERAQYRKTTAGWTGTPESEVLSRIPLVVWTSDEEMRGIISEELITMNDEYNAGLNAQGDDIRNVVDCLVKMWGIDSRWLTEHESDVLKKRLLPFDGTRTEQDAEYLQRNMDIEPHTRHLTVVREMIHIMGNIPDVLRIVGASGSASGIALKLMFTPMEQAFEAYSPMLCEAILARIDLLNARLNILQGYQPIDEADVRLQFKIPTNRIEEWQNISSLEGIVSHATQLELLSDIEDPENELDALRAEGSGEVTTEDRFLEQERRQQQLEGLLLDQAEQTASDVARIADALKGAMINNTTPSTEADAEQ